MNDASLHLRADDPGSLRLIGPWIREQLVPSLDERAAEIVHPKIELGLTELCGNIFEHGYAGAGDGELTVSFTVSASHVAVLIVDEGAAFGVADTVADKANPDPADPQVEEQNGYGMFIVRRLTSHFVVERVGNQNRTVVHFDLP